MLEATSRNEGIFNIVGLLNACARENDLGKGCSLHTYICQHESLQKSFCVARALVNMYARCGALREAQQVLNRLPSLDVVTWTTLIAGFIQQGQGEEALECFDKMQCEGHSPDSVTFTCALKACGKVRAAAKGEEIHDKILSSGMLEKSVVLGNTLVDMYVRCGALAKAQKVFYELPVRDVVTWNALIGGYSQHGQGEEALKCFDTMQIEGYAPNVVTFICVLKACGSIRAVVMGERIHDKVVSLGMLEKSIVLGNAVVDMYAKCGALTKAQAVFHKLPVRNVVTWNSLIAGYVHHDQAEEALKCFHSMQCNGTSPNSVTFSCVLKACGSTGAVDRGENIHNTIVDLGMLEKDVVIGNSLVDMYLNCGALAQAQEVFDKLPIRNVVTWTALIAGYALHGHCRDALNCFQRLQCSGVEPNSATMVCMLNACSNSGLLEKAEMFLSSMSFNHGISLHVQHYCCMIDLFARAGKFNKALEMIEKMPSSEYVSVWLALLGACRNWGDVKIGKLAFKHALHLDKSDTAAYICMSGIYTAAGMQEDMNKLEVLRTANKARSRPVMEMETIHKDNVFM